MKMRLLLSARRCCCSAAAAEGQTMSLVAERSPRRRKPHVAGAEVEVAAAEMLRLPERDAAAEAVVVWAIADMLLRV